MNSLHRRSRKIHRLPGPIAALGWLDPMIAGAAMALSSLSVIVNSSLLRRTRQAWP